MNVVSVAEASRVLVGRHYLGPTRKAAFALRDEHGVLIFARPRGRNVPASWLELVRWCLLDGKGSMQWRAAVPLIRAAFPDVSTVLSYSDPSVGHTGALYRACNWLWAPTWHRLRPPPTGNGSWTEGKAQAVKDRWVFPLAPDGARAAQLAVQDDAVQRAMPWASYREPIWRKGRFDPATGGGRSQTVSRGQCAMSDDPETIYTVDDLRKAAWSQRTTARATGKDGPFTVALSDCKINGVTVRGAVTTYADGRREIVYQVHGQTVGSLDEVAAIMSGRWVAGDDKLARDD